MAANFFKSKENRAQAAAPFELFVAVIVMAFVMVMGYVVLNMVNTEVCLNQVDKEMGKFKTAFEDTVNRKSSNSFYFLPPAACFSSKETVMKLELIKQPRVCADRCGFPADECNVLTFSNPTVANAFKQKCVDLPQYTSIMPKNDNVTCADDGSLSGNGFVIVDPRENGTAILSGQYVIRNVSPAGDTFPKICVWYKAAS